MSKLTVLFAFMICMLWTAPHTQSEQLKTGILQTAPSPTQLTSTPMPTPQTPAVKTAPKVTAPVPTKQGPASPLGQKTSIAVKSPAQGTQHPAGKPLAIIWDKSSISTAAAVNILLVDKPGGTAKATIRAGAPNTGSFTSWVAPQQYAATANSWAVRIETTDNKASGHSGVFSFQAPAAAPLTTKATVPSLTSGRSVPGQDASTPSAPEGQTDKMLLLEELKLGQRKDFSRASLAGLSLNNLNLEQATFLGADLSGADMSGANLMNCDFTGANLTGANLTGAKCQKVSFRNARMNNANLTNTFLSYADLTGAILNGAIFKGSNNLGYKYLKVPNSEGYTYTDCYFANHDFKNISMKNVTIDGGKFLGCDFTESQLDGVIINNNPNFSNSKIPVKFINIFQGKTDSFPNILWVN